MFINITVKGYSHTRWSSKVVAVKVIVIQIDQAIVILENLRDIKAEIIATLVHLLETLIDKFNDWTNMLYDKVIIKAEKICNEWEGYIM